MTYADTFDLSQGDAEQILGEIDDATTDWRKVATSHGISESDCNRFEGAFETMREPIQALTSGTTPSSRPGPRRALSPAFPRASRVVAASQPARDAKGRR